MEKFDHRPQEIIWLWLTTNHDAFFLSERGKKKREREREKKRGKYFLGTTTF